MPPLIVAISDTHGEHDQIIVPPGDILIHAGDLSRRGSLRQIAEVNDWLGSLPHRHKIIIAGNHDFAFEREPEVARQSITNAIYLEDEAVTIDGITIYGSPWQPRFFNWAFNAERGDELANIWANIPMKTDILVTHGPPRGIGDLVYDGRREGCDDLLERIRIVQPRMHIFGHIHEGAGIYRDGPTTFINAACMRMSEDQTEVGPFVIDYATGERM